jgi:hypothetical protein
MGIKIKSKGNFNSTDKYFYKAQHIMDKDKIEEIANSAVLKLKLATPISSPETLNGWGYSLVYNNSGFKLTFTNSNIQNGINVAILLNDGHATKEGTWISGLNYLPEVTREIYDDIMDKTWKELKNL